tara:strand:+ start:709 stop:993 length:285 start_codon:yes stop_codon:yes gene_type:complete
VSDDGEKSGDENTPPGPARLSWLVARELGLWVWCEKCSHHTVLAAAPLLARFGDTTLQALSRRFKCSQCGQHEVFLRPDWPRRGVVSRHDKLDE